MALDGYYVTRLEEALNNGLKGGKKIVIEFLVNNIYQVYQEACKEACVSEDADIRLFYSSSQTPQKCSGPVSFLESIEKQQKQIIEEGKNRRSL